MDSGGNRPPLNTKQLLFSSLFVIFQGQNSPLFLLFWSSFLGSFFFPILEISFVGVYFKLGFEDFFLTGFQAWISKIFLISSLEFLLFEINLQISNPSFSILTSVSFS